MMDLYAPIQTERFLLAHVWLRGFLYACGKAALTITRDMAKWKKSKKTTMQQYRVLRLDAQKITKAA